MQIAVLHDYANVFRETRAYLRLHAHEVTIYTEAYTEPARVIEQAAGCDALLLTQQRVPLTRQIVEHLPQTSGSSVKPGATRITSILTLVPSGALSSLPAGAVAAGALIRLLPNSPGA